MQPSSFAQSPAPSSPRGDTFRLRGRVFKAGVTSGKFFVSEPARCSEKLRRHGLCELSIPKVIAINGAARGYNSSVTLR